MRSVSGGGSAERLVIHAGSFAPTACGDGSGPGGVGVPQPNSPIGNSQSAARTHVLPGARSAGRVLRNTVMGPSSVGRKVFRVAPTRPGDGRQSKSGPAAE